MAPPKGNGWEKLGYHVLEKLVANDDSHKEIMSELKIIAVDIAQLKIKSGVWGAVAGLIPTAIVIMYFLLK